MIIRILYFVHLSWSLSPHKSGEWLVYCLRPSVLTSAFSRLRILLSFWNSLLCLLFLKSSSHSHPYPKVPNYLSFPDATVSECPEYIVTTRTTTLTSVPHTAFNLRFSDLQDVEEACREDDEQRAIRTIDWMTGRISSRCAKWVKEVDLLGDKETLRTPWWDELRRCAEGDFVPSKTEGWNHPVARMSSFYSLQKNSRLIFRVNKSYLLFQQQPPTPFKLSPLCIHGIIIFPHGSTPMSCDTL